MTTTPSIKTRFKLIDYIARNPGTLQIDICKEFNYQRDTVRLYLAWLTRNELVVNKSNFACIETRNKHKELYPGHVYG